MTLQHRQQKLNEEGGTLCGCDAWSDYARVDGGWVAAGLGLAWGLTGGHGCENVAAGDPAWNARMYMCMYCQAGPTDECDEHERLVSVEGGDRDWRRDQRDDGGVSGKNRWPHCVYVSSSSPQLPLF